MFGGGGHRILYVVPYVPLKGTRGPQGPKNFTEPIVRYLSEKHQVTLVIIAEEGVLVEGKVRRAFPLLERVVSFQQPAGWRRVLRWMHWVARGYPATVGRCVDSRIGNFLIREAARHDLVHLDFFPLAPYASILKPYAPIVLTCHDAYSLARRRARLAAKGAIEGITMWLREAAFRKLEKRHYPEMDAVVTVSPVDADYLRVCGLNEVRTVPVPLDLDTDGMICRKWSERAEVLCVVPPVAVRNVIYDAINFLAIGVPRIREAVGRDLKITVWGGAAYKIRKAIKEKDGLTFLDTVPDYFRFLSRRWVYVYPRRVGAGLHTKVLEAMGMGLPVVGYEEIMGAFGGRSGYHYISCKTLDEMIEAVVQLTLDRELREKIASCAANFVSERFSRTRAGHAIEEIYADVLNRKGRRQR